MKENIEVKGSQIIPVLREGIGVIQMVLFKELRIHITKKYPERDITSRSMLIGAIINRLFGTDNPEEKFQIFNQENNALIEQEIIGLPENVPELMPFLSDALRMQVICDNHEGLETGAVLIQAESYGILSVDRETPLPSAFMTIVRKLGEDHGLTVAPVQINPEEEKTIIH